MPERLTGGLAQAGQCLVGQFVRKITVSASWQVQWKPRLTPSRWDVARKREPTVRTSTDHCKTIKK